MFALAATNVVAAVLFGTLYAVAGAGKLSQAGFLACLALLFALMTVLWVRVEGRHRALEPVRRLGRVAIGFGAVALAVPIVVLMPIFWLDTALPPEAGLNRLLAPIMTLVLIALVLVALVNVVGGVLAAGSALTGRWRAAGRS
jgi:hypothetical protein